MHFNLYTYSSSQMFCMYIGSHPRIRSVITWSMFVNKVLSSVSSEVAVSVNYTKYWDSQAASSFWFLSLVRAFCIQSQLYHQHLYTTVIKHVICRYPLKLTKISSKTWLKNPTITTSLIKAAFPYSCFEKTLRKRQVQRSALIWSLDPTTMTNSANRENLRIRQFRQQNHALCTQNPVAIFHTSEALPRRTHSALYSKQKGKCWKT